MAARSRSWRVTLEWDGHPSPSVVNYYERGVSTCSVSKTLGMSGLRLGWLATRDGRLLEDCMDLKYYISLHQQSRLDEIVATVNYNVTMQWIRSNGTFKGATPKGGFLMFPSYDLDIPLWDLCIRLLDPPYRTHILPGSCYGVEGHVRLGFGPGTSAHSLREGLEQIGNFVADYQAGRVRFPSPMPALST